MFWVWTAWVQLHVDFIKSKFYGFAWSTVGWIFRCGTVDTEEQLIRKPYPLQDSSKIQRTEKTGVVQSMGSQRVRHDWATNTFTFLTHICIYKYTHTYTEREREKVKLLLLVTQLYSTFYNSMDYSTLVSSVRGISQARKLERVPISSSRGTSRTRDWTMFSALAGGLFTGEPPSKPKICRRGT